MVDLTDDEGSKISLPFWHNTGMWRTDRRTKLLYQYRGLCSFACTSEIRIFCWKFKHYDVSVFSVYLFLPRDAMCSLDLCCCRMSVCLSVCLWCSDIVSNRLKISAVPNHLQLRGMKITCIPEMVQYRATVTIEG